MTTTQAVNPSAFALKVQDQAARANELIQTARVALATGNPLVGVTVDEVLFEAQELTEQTRMMARTAAGMAVPPSPIEIPLEQLDTPDTRRLLALLEEAQATAELVDAARGRAVPEGTPLNQGESRGTDLAESVSLLALRMRNEVCGARGRD